MPSDTGGHSELLRWFGIPLTGANPPTIFSNPTLRKTFPMGPPVPATATIIQATDSVTTTSTVISGSNGVPNVLLSVSAAQSPVKQQTSTNCEVTITFTVDPSDTNFDHVDVWMVGYHGSGVAQLIASGNSSPINFFLDATKEFVTFYCQTVSADGKSANLYLAASATVTLSGVVSTPPAPTISQTLVSTPLGYQFGFNQVVLAAGTQDIITAYRVYRNTSANTFSGSTLLRTFVNDPTNTGAIVVQDNTGGGFNYYYFVTSVNSAGYESTSTAAQSGAVNSGTASLTTDVVDGTTRFAATASALTYRPLSNPLTGHDAGSNVTVNVAAFTLRTSNKGDINVNSGSVTALSYATLYYIYYDDPTLAGATVTFNATTTKETAIQGLGRIFIGSIITPAATAPDSNGNNDGGVGAQAGQTSVFLGGSFTNSVHTLATVALNNCIDGNLTTFGFIKTTSSSGAASGVGSIQGFAPTSEPWLSLTLYIRSAVPTNPAGCVVQLQYSLDGGGSSTFVYNLSATTRALTVDSISLPTSQNLALVQISLSVTRSSGTAIAELDLYEAWIVGQQ